MNRSTPILYGTNFLHHIREWSRCRG